MTAVGRRRAIRMRNALRDWVPGLVLFLAFLLILVIR